MIKINLLPHREEKRKQLKNDYFTLLAASAILGALVVVLVGTVYSLEISAQVEKNNFIKAKNVELDQQIKEVAQLKQEIEALKARQQAVEDLQSDRNQPVFMLDELVKLTPEGVYLRSLKQDGQQIVITGYAQSNERVSEYMKSLANPTSWFEVRGLVEIKASSIGQGKDAKRVSDFELNIGIKRPREREEAKDSASGDAAKKTVN